MDRAGLITLEQARAAGLSFDEPEPRACPHCGAALDPLGAALAGRVAWVSAAPCPCEGAASERESEARRRAALAAKEEAARREKALSRAGIPRRYWAAEADRPEFAEYIASFAGNGGAGLYIHGGVGAGKTHAASAMARLFAEAGYDVAFTTAKGMLERVKATFDEGGTEAAVARYAKCDVLVLDDLGKEDATEWSVGTVFSVLDARYEDMRPTIVTSNYAPGALADRLARRGEMQFWSKRRERPPIAQGSGSPRSPRGARRPSGWRSAPSGRARRRGPTARASAGTAARARSRGPRDEVAGGGRAGRGGVRRGRLRGRGNRGVGHEPDPRPGGRHGGDPRGAPRGARLLRGGGSPVRRDRLRVRRAPRLGPLTGDQGGPARRRGAR